MKKRFIMLLLVLCAVVCCAAGANAAEIVNSGYCGGEGDGTNLTWTLDSEGTLIINGTGSMEDYTSGRLYPYWYDSSVKTAYISYGVTSIGDRAFYDCDKLTSVTISDSVMSIGNNAFDDCNSLSSVSIGSNVTSIGGWAFWKCTSLTSVTIPDSVASIGYSAFGSCAKLTSIDVMENNNAYSSLSGVVFNKDKTTLIAYPSGLEGSYTIPDSVTSIDSYAFNSCESLTGVTIGKNITSIGNDAFINCTGQ